MDNESWASPSPHRVWGRCQGLTTSSWSYRRCTILGQGHGYGRSYFSEVTTEAQGRAHMRRRSGRGPQLRDSRWAGGEGQAPSPVSWGHPSISTDTPPSLPGQTIYSSLTDPVEPMGTAAPPPPPPHEVLTASLEPSVSIFSGTGEEIEVQNGAVACLKWHRQRDKLSGELSFGIVHPTTWTYIPPMMKRGS